MHPTSILKAPSFELGGLKRHSPRLQVHVSASRITFAPMATKRVTRFGSVSIEHERLSIREEKVPIHGVALSSNQIVPLEVGYDLEERWKRQIKTRLVTPAPFQFPPKKVTRCNAPEWQNTLDFFADQVRAQLAHEKIPVTDKTLLVRMLYLSQNKKEVIRLSDLQEIYASLAIDALYGKYAIKKMAGTRKATGKATQDVILEAVKKNITVPKLIKFLKVSLSNPGTENSILSIKRINDQTYVLKYNQVSLTAIKAHLAAQPPRRAFAFFDYVQSKIKRLFNLMGTG